MRQNKTESKFYILYQHSLTRESRAAFPLSSPTSPQLLFLQTWKISPFGDFDKLKVPRGCVHSQPSLNSKGVLKFLMQKQQIPHLSIANLPLGRQAVGARSNKKVQQNKNFLYNHAHILNLGLHPMSRGWGCTIGALGVSVISKSCLKYKVNCHQILTWVPFMKILKFQNFGCFVHHPISIGQQQPKIKILLPTSFALPSCFRKGMT